MNRYLIATPFLALALLGACTSNSDNDNGNTPPPPPPSPQYLIRGAGMSGYNENLVVSLDGAASPATAVTVNGDTIAPSAAGSTFYSGHLSTVVTAGGTVQVHVSNGTITAIGTGVVPATPVITAVQHGGVGAPVTITWTSATSPDSFAVSLDYRLPDNSVASIDKMVVGSARSVTIATTDIPANGAVFSAGVDAAMNGVFSGSFAAGSNLHLRAVGASFAVTVP